MLNDKVNYSSSKGSYVYIFENVNEYEDEIIDLMEDNRMSFQDLKYQIESWGGTVDIVMLDRLISSYKKKQTLSQRELCGDLVLILIVQNTTTLTQY